MPERRHTGAASAPPGPAEEAPQRMPRLAPILPLAGLFALPVGLVFLALAVTGALSPALAALAALALLLLVFLTMARHLIGLLRLTYDPTITHNLRVRNNSIDTVEVIVGVRSYGDVLPTTSREFFVDTGRRDLFFRRTGQSTGRYFGTFNFNTTTVVDVQFP